MSHAAKVYEASCALDSDIVMVEWDAGMRLFFPSKPLMSRRTTIDTIATTSSHTDDHEVDQERKEENLGYKTRRNLRETGRNILFPQRQISESTTTHFPARKCSCLSRYRNVDTSYYCLTLNDENACRIPVAEDQPIECLRLLSSQSFIRNSWPVAVLWLATMVLYLVTTTGGRFAMRYLCFKVSSCFRLCFCFCCRSHHGPNPHDARMTEWPNHHIINQVIAMQERSQRRRFRQTTAVGQGGENLHARSQDPVTYILKTTQFNKKSMSSPSEQTLPVTPCTLSPSSSSSEDNVGDNGDNDTFSDNDDVLCTICLTSIEDGDRVGVLSCDHLFHSECLKAWIQRKNVCPLCQTPDIAKEKEAVSNERGGSAIDESPTTVQRTSVRSTGVDVSSHRYASTRRSPRNDVNTSTAPNATTRTRTRIATFGTSVRRNLFRTNDNQRRGSTTTGGGNDSGSSSTSNNNNDNNLNTNRRPEVGNVNVVGGSTIGVGTVRIRMNLHPNNATIQRESPSQRRERLNRMRQAWNGGD